MLTEFFATDTGHVTSPTNYMIRLKTSPINTMYNNVDRGFCYRYQLCHISYQLVDNTKDFTNQHNV